MNLGLNNSQENPTPNSDASIPRSSSQNRRSTYRKSDSPMPKFDREHLLSSDLQNRVDVDAQLNQVSGSFNLSSASFATDQAPNSDQQQRRGCCRDFYVFELFKVYDNKFLTALGLQYLNTGMKAMTTLAFLDLFRTEYALEPTETQSLTAAMTLSWTPKLFYGIISDTFPIFGTRKKSYIVLMGLLQFSTAWAIAMVNFKSPIYVCVLGFFMNLASAFMDVVVDGLMVMQARRDQTNGSQNLQTFSWQLLGIGGIIGGLAGGLITQYWDTHLIFYIFGTLGLLIALSGFLMDASIEADQMSVITMSLGQRMRQNCHDIRQGFKVRELWRSFIFFFLLGCLVPSFGDFFYYYQLEVVGFSKLTYALCGSLGFFYLVIAMQLYNWYLKEKETFYMMIIACFTNLIGSLGCILFVRQIYFGMSPLAFMIMTSTITDLLQDAFQRLPGMVLFAKMIPSNIESSMFAMLTGLMNLSQGFTSKMLGNLINTFVGVKQGNLSQLWILYVVQAACALLPLMFLWLVPTKSEVENVQKAIEFIERREAIVEEQKTKKVDSKNTDVALKNPQQSIDQDLTAATSVQVEDLTPEVKAVLLRIRPEAYHSFVQQEQLSKAVVDKKKYEGVTHLHSAAVRSERLTETPLSAKVIRGGEGRDGVGLDIKNHQDRSPTQRSNMTEDYPPRQKRKP